MGIWNIKLCVYWNLSLNPGGQPRRFEQSDNQGEKGFTVSMGVRERLMEKYLISFKFQTKKYTKIRGVGTAQN